MSGTFTLTSENYYSLEADKQYMSNSQYQSFVECEAKAMAKLRGEYEEPNKDAFLIGSIVHAWNEGEDKLQEFKDNHPEIISSKGATKGEIKKEFQIAEHMIDCLKNDEFAMFILSQGKPEVVLSAEMFGTPWKIRIDRDCEKRWVEIKTVKSIDEMYWQYNELSERNEKVNFLEKWNYIRNAAVYAEVERLARGRSYWKEAVALVVSKETPCDKELISLYNPDVEEQGIIFGDYLAEIEQNMPRVLAVKAGIEKPNGCGVCDYCKQTKKLSKLVYWQDIGYRRVM